MSVIPISVSNRNAIAEAPPVARNSAPAFKANEMEKDSFVKRPKESWLHKYRDIVGFIAGGLVGDLIWAKGLRNKVEGIKKMSGWKLFAINVGLDIVLGYIGSKIALQFGKKEQSSNIH